MTRSYRIDGVSRILAGLVCPAVAGLCLTLAGCCGPTARPREAAGDAPWVAQVAHDITGLRRITAVEDGNKPVGPEIDAAPLTRWIQQAERTEEAHLSLIAATSWVFLADSDAGRVMAVISEEKFVHDGVAPLCITVKTLGNPALIYRYRVREEDRQAITAWADGHDGAIANPAGGPRQAP